MENPNVKYYEIPSTSYDLNKLKYSLVDIQIDNISKFIKDESIRDAIILKPDEYKEKYKEKHEREKQQLLYDLALLENVSEIRN